jgi:hypothetical protein
MSLNRTLSRIFDEVRREARRNPRFADRLEAIIAAHSSFREVSLLDDVGDLALLEGPERAPAPLPQEPPPPKAPATPSADAALNPVALFTRGGADSLREALAGEDMSRLEALVSEHHLDPAGVAKGLKKPELVEHIVTQARKRVERDRKLFDY